MRSSLKTSVLALVCALALFATACGSGSDAATGTAGDDSASTDEESAPSESPLADLIGIPFTDDEAMDDYFSDLSRQAEAKTAECMLAQGFQYTPIDYSSLDDVGSIDFDTREFAEEYGFGIASNPFEEVFEASADVFENPNGEYLSTLSDGERAAYETALEGDMDFSAGAFEPGGCIGESYNELFSFFTVFESFESEFQELEEAYEADPRIVEATSGWASCMSEAGYNYADVDGAESDIERRYNAIVDDPDAFETIDDVVGSAEDFENPEDFDGEIFFGPGTLNPEFQVRVDELADEERAIAVASWDCNAPLREIDDDIRLEYETRFVDQNGAAITEALAE